jgi:hypothetical protein
MAETIVITCSACQKRFKGKPELRGKKIRCPFCREIFKVPGDGKAASAFKAAPSQEPATPLLLDEDDDEDSNPYGITTLDLTPRCPHCANPLESEDALICLYCGYNTQTRSLGKTKKIIEHTAGEHFWWLFPGLLCVTFILLQTMFVIFYCITLPGLAKDASWLQWTDHESMRLWTTVPALFDIWPIGMYAFKRLVIEPTPPEKVKD